MSQFLSGAGKQLLEPAHPIRSVFEYDAELLHVVREYRSERRMGNRQRNGCYCRVCIEPGACSSSLGTCRRTAVVIQGDAWVDDRDDRLVEGEALPEMLGAIGHQAGGGEVAEVTAPPEPLIGRLAGTVEVAVSWALRL